MVLQYIEEMTLIKLLEPGTHLKTPLFVPVYTDPKLSTMTLMGVWNEAKVKRIVPTVLPGLNFITRLEPQIRFDVPKAKRKSY